MMNEYNKAQEKKNAFYKNENLFLSKRKLESNQVEETTTDENSKKMKSSDEVYTAGNFENELKASDKNVICRHAKYLK